MGYSPWGGRVLDMNAHVHTILHCLSELTESDMASNAIRERIITRNYTVVLFSLAGSIRSPAQEKLNSSQKRPGKQA